MANQLEKLATKLATMNREALKKALQKMHCDFRLDFTDEFLDTISEERLRHIVLAAGLHAHEVAASQV